MFFVRNPRFRHEWVKMSHIKIFREQETHINNTISLPPLSSSSTLSITGDDPVSWQVPRDLHSEGTVSHSYFQMLFNFPVAPLFRFFSLRWASLGPTLLSCLLVFSQERAAGPFLCLKEGPNIPDTFPLRSVFAFLPFPVAFLS